MRRSKDVSAASIRYLVWANRRSLVVSHCKIGDCMIQTVPLVYGGPRSPEGRCFDTSDAGAVAVTFIPSQPWFQK